MPLRKSDFDAALKIHYFGAIKDMLENATALLSRMQTHEEETGGKHLHIPVRTGRTPSIGARGDSSLDANLPVGATPSYSQATFVVKPQYSTIRLTGFAMRSSRSPNFAFARAQVRDMEDTTKDFKKDINRQLFGNGSGQLGQVNTAGATTAPLVKNALYPLNPTKFMYANEVVDIKLIATSADVSASNTITAVNATNQITVTSFSGVTTTQGIYREDNLTDGATDPINEMYGLEAAIDDANPNTLGADTQTPTPANAETINYGSIDRSLAANKHWQANVLTNSGTLRPFSVNLVEQGIDKGEEESGGSTSLIQTNYAIFRIYGALLAAAKQADMAKMELDGGFKALSVNGIPMVRDVECPDYRIYCIDETTFYLGVTGPWAWLEDDAGGILSRLAQQDVYEGALNRDMQLMCDKPRANTKIEDVSHS